MKTFKELSYSKYLQPWYKNKIKAALWKNCVFKPIIYYKLVKDTIASMVHDGGDILANPDYRWLYNLFKECGYMDGVANMESIKRNLQYGVECFNKHKSKG